MDLDEIRKKHAYERLALEKEITKEAREQAEKEAEKAKQEAERLAKVQKDKDEIRQQLQDELKAAQTGQDPEKDWRPIEKRLEDLEASPQETGQYKKLWQQVDQAQQERKRLDDLKTWSDQQAETIKAPEQQLDEYLKKLDDAGTAGYLSDEQRTRLEEAARSKFQVDNAAVSVQGTFNSAALRGLEAGDASSRIVKATEETARQTKLLVDTIRRSDGLTFAN